ncbi:MFS transporter permease [Curtobacterium sp. VKM Ac-1395]|uniref:MFS transporter permease n=1 Tax=Curtobacterium sp. VKM Ac-1395 TaxID=2783815 RepID=UPI00188B9500|nr:MFS transporter permease [Curtobacterium sp. VKM Ac-1395]MBF4588821.1 MFS transporter permease [Curtobacterium sp. VKM Ac-1395]
MTAWSGRSGRRFGRERPPRARGVWIATVVGVLVVLLVFTAGFLPLVGFLGGVTATTAGLVPFPFVRVTLVTVLGGLVVLGLLVLAVTRRRTVAAWVPVVLAVLVTVAVTVYPLVAVAVGSADRAGDVWPIITDLVRRVTG